MHASYCTSFQLNLGVCTPERYNVPMADTIFTKIINGELPCHKVYEDDKTLAFLDINPVQPGHTLVISKLPVIVFVDLPEQDAVAFWATVQKVGKRLKEVFPDKKRIAVQLEGLDVPHVHAKLFPFDTPEQFRTIPDSNATPDHEALAAMAKKLAF